MPTYDYSCKKCGNTFEKRLSIAERETPCASPCTQCGHAITQAILGTPKIVSGVRTHASAPEGFKDVMRTIHKHAGRESKIDV